MTTYDIPPAFPSHLLNPARPDGTWVDAGRLAYLRSQGDEPTFSVGEAAAFFFGMSVSWLRMRMTPPVDPDPGTAAARHPAAWFTEEDILVPLKVTKVRGNGTYEYRRFTLTDIENMIWSLYRHGVIEAVYYYNLVPQTGKRAEHRMERYQEMMTDSMRRLRISLELIKWLGRLYDVTLMPEPS